MFFYTCAVTKLIFFFIKKVKTKNMFCCYLTCSRFSFFFPFFQCFSSVCCYVKQILGGFHLFSEDFFRIQFQLISFNKTQKCCCNICQSQRAHVKSCSTFYQVFLGKCLQNSVLNFISLDCEL